MAEINKRRLVGQLRQIAVQIMTRKLFRVLREEEINKRLMIEGTSDRFIVLIPKDSPIFQPWGFSPVFSGRPLASDKVVGALNSSRRFTTLSVIIETSQQWKNTPTSPWLPPQWTRAVPVIGDTKGAFVTHDYMMFFGLTVIGIWTDEVPITHIASCYQARRQKLSLSGSY